MITGKVFLTGGSGTLGKAIIRRAHDENWDCAFTIYSRDPMKQFAVKREYPEVNLILGSVEDFQTLTYAIAGHDVVLHLAAQKHIPSGEFNVMHTINVNLQGSINVAEACVENGVKDCIGISTDKAVHPVNVYGATKYLMEKVFQEYATKQDMTKFNLVRYGNVLGSTGSVIQVWREMEEKGEVHATDPDMSRFWLTVDNAVDGILMAYNTYNSGVIVIPMCNACTMRDLASYVLKSEPIYDGIRPGEKRHEELLGREESRWAELMPGRVNNELDAYYLNPTTTDPIREFTSGVKHDTRYVSENPAEVLDKETVLEMIGEKE